MFIQNGSFEMFPGCLYKGYGNHNASSAELSLFMAELVATRGYKYWAGERYRQTATRREQFHNLTRTEKVSTVYLQFLY